ncbi:MAG: phosphoglucomutase/phosphomannomutase family protein [Candidatus Omnitrophica bacterium]|nr:phosphoglucomutase/phosphomannomutase family protein [Candidatus Omnitrophota bacterium]
MNIVFGTEGWRAVIAEHFTFDNVRAVAQAIAEHYQEAAGGQARLTMAVGYDTRFLSDRFARAVCEVFAANGIQSVVSDRAIPTCAVSRYVVAHHLACGIVITASHNPAIYNGIKVKEAFGGSATTDTVASIERRVGHHPIKRLPFEQAVEQRVVRTAEFLPLFLKGIRDAVDLKVIRQSRLKAVADAMHGTAGRLIEQLLAGGRCRVETIHAEADPLFGGHAPEPIAIHLQELAKTVRRRRAQVGVANDGDADRIGVIAANGLFLNPGQILCILLEHLIHSRKWQGTVVKTVSNTSMIDRMAHALGLPVREVPVGFKHIAKLMLEGEVLIGGEESGGIGIRGYLPERDGILMALLVMEAMAAQGRGVLEILKRLERRYGRWSYTRRDLAVPHEQVNRVFERLTANPPSRIAGVPVRERNTLDGVKLIDRQDNWLLFRRSGTEPIVRVYAESLTVAHANRLLEFGVQLVNTS